MAAVKKVADKAVEENAVAEKETEKTTAASKTVKKPAEKKAVAPKKTTAAKTPAAEKTQAAEKAAAAKKTPAKKAEPKATVVIEYGENQIVAKEVLDAATKAYKANHRGVTIKTIEVYIQPENNVAYYVVNGEGSDDFKVSL